MKGVKVWCAVGAICACLIPVIVAVPGTSHAAEIGAKAETTSEVCFNPKFFEERSFISYRERTYLDGDPYIAIQLREVEKARKFKGVEAIVVRLKETLAGGTSTKRQYFKIKNNMILQYGQTGLGATLVYDPPIKTPTQLKIDEEFTQKYTLNARYKDQDSRPATANVEKSIRMDGFETLQTKIGTFKTCRITTKSTTVVIKPEDGILTSTVVEWYAAEGPYIGLKLKRKASGVSYGRKYNSLYNVFAVDEFDVE